MIIKHCRIRRFVNFCVMLSACSMAFAQETDPTSQSVESKWLPLRAMPVVVVAKVNADSEVVDILHPVEEYGVETVEYTVQVPVIANGKTTYRAESRTRTIPRTYMKLEQRQIPLTAEIAFEIGGQKISTDDLKKRLKEPTHVFFGEMPDKYAKSVLKDDLIVIVDKSTPKAAPPANRNSGNP